MISIGKLFICLLCKILSKWATEKYIFTEAQFAQRVRVSHYISLIYRIQTKQKLYCAFVDFTTAFDSINRNMLFSRLIKCGISSKMIHIIIALYTNVMSCVKLNKSNTDIFSCKDGLRQGDSLSPILFSFYINDLPSKQSRVNTSTDIDILLYAYDLGYIS